MCTFANIIFSISLLFYTKFAENTKTRKNYNASFIIIIVRAL